MYKVVSMKSAYWLPALGPDIRTHALRDDEAWPYYAEMRLPLRLRS
jgi:hypothetical protein